MSKHSSTRETLQRRLSSQGSGSSTMDRTVTRRLSMGIGSDATSVSGFSDGSYEDLQGSPSFTQEAEMQQASDVGAEVCIRQPQQNHSLRASADGCSVVSSNGASNVLLDSFDDWLGTEPGASGGYAMSRTAHHPDSSQTDGSSFSLPGRPGKYGGSRDGVESSSTGTMDTGTDTAGTASSITARQLPPTQQWLPEWDEHELDAVGLGGGSEAGDARGAAPSEAGSRDSAAELASLGASLRQQQLEEGGWREASGNACKTADPDAQSTTQAEQWEDRDGATEVKEEEEEEIEGGGLGGEWEHTMNLGSSMMAALAAPSHSAASFQVPVEEARGEYSQLSPPRLSAIVEEEEEEEEEDEIVGEKGRGSGLLWNEENGVENEGGNMTAIHAVADSVAGSSISGTTAAIEEALVAALEAAEVGSSVSGTTSAAARATGDVGSSMSGTTAAIEEALGAVVEAAETGSSVSGTTAAIEEALGAVMEAAETGSSVSGATTIAAAATAAASATGDTGSSMSGTTAAIEAALGAVMEAAEAGSSVSSVAMAINNAVTTLAPGSKLVEGKPKVDGREETMSGRGAALCDAEGGDVLQEATLECPAAVVEDDSASEVADEGRSRADGVTSQGSALAAVRARSAASSTSNSDGDGSRAPEEAEPMARPASSPSAAPPHCIDGRWVPRTVESEAQPQAQPRPCAARRRGASAPPPPAELLRESSERHCEAGANRMGRPPTSPPPQPLLLPLASGSWMSGVSGAGGRVFNVAATDIGGAESDPTVWPAPKGGAFDMREAGGSALMASRSFSGPHVDISMLGIGSAAPSGRSAKWAIPVSADRASWASAFELGEQLVDGGHLRRMQRRRGSSSNPQRSYNKEMQQLLGDDWLGTADEDADALLDDDQKSPLPLQGGLPAAADSRDRIIRHRQKDESQPSQVAMEAAYGRHGSSTCRPLSTGASQARHSAETRNRLATKPRSRPGSASGARENIGRSPAMGGGRCRTPLTWHFCRPTTASVAAASSVMSPPLPIGRRRAEAHPRRPVTAPHPADSPFGTGGIMADYGRRFFSAEAKASRPRSPSRRVTPPLLTRPLTANSPSFEVKSRVEEDLSRLQLPPRPSSTAAAHSRALGLTSRKHDSSLGTQPWAAPTTPSKQHKLSGISNGWGSKRRTASAAADVSSRSGAAGRSTVVANTASHGSTHVGGKLRSSKSARPAAVARQRNGHSPPPSRHSPRHRVDQRAGPQQPARHSPVDDASRASPAAATTGRSTVVPKYTAPPGCGGLHSGVRAALGYTYTRSADFFSEVAVPLPLAPAELLPVPVELPDRTVVVSRQLQNHFRRLLFGVAEHVVEKEAPRRAWNAARSTVDYVLQRVDGHIEAPGVVPDILERMLDAAASRSEAVDVAREALQAVWEGANSQLRLSCGERNALDVESMMSAVARVGLPLIRREDWPTWGRGLAHHRRAAEVKVAALRQRNAATAYRHAARDADSFAAPSRRKTPKPAIDEQKNMTKSTAAEATTKIESNAGHSSEDLQSQIHDAGNVGDPPAIDQLPESLPSTQQGEGAEVGRHSIVPSITSASHGSDDCAPKRTAEPASYAASRLEDLPSHGAIDGMPQPSDRPMSSSSVPVSYWAPNHETPPNERPPSRAELVQGTETQRSEKPPQPPAMARPPPAGPTQRQAANTVPRASSSLQSTPAAPPSWSKEARRVDSLPAEMRKYGSELKWPESPTLPPSRSDSGFSLGGGSDSARVSATRKGVVAESSAGGDSDRGRGTKQAIGQTLSSGAGVTMRPSRSRRFRRPRGGGVADESSMVSLSSRDTESESSFDAEAPGMRPPTPHDHAGGPIIKRSDESVKSEATTAISSSAAAADAELSMRFIHRQDSTASSGAASNQGHDKISASRSASSSSSASRGMPDVNNGNGNITDANLVTDEIQSISAKSTSDAHSLPATTASPAAPSPAFDLQAASMSLESPPSVALGSDNGRYASAAAIEPAVMPTRPTQTADNDSSNATFAAFQPYPSSSALHPRQPTVSGAMAPDSLMRAASQDETSIMTRPATPVAPPWVSSLGYHPQNVPLHPSSSARHVPQLTGGYQAAVAARLADQQRQQQQQQQQVAAVPPYYYVGPPSSSLLSSSPPQTHPPLAPPHYGGAGSAMELSSRYAAAADRRLEERVRSFAASSSSTSPTSTPPHSPPSASPLMGMAPPTFSPPHAAWATGGPGAASPLMAAYSSATDEKMSFKRLGSAGAPGGDASDTLMAKYSVAVSSNLSARVDQLTSY